ncbi:hypothetical protein CAPTEDRAFT_190561 [Capitella teleta]|uniref:Reverse transcriptase domain-containing protein n=1 Tax=Capitella teleta TaxID=283909 RepID=R7TUM9_CAPTE|nr:hypothetical protein CAPTEDRAFT_190561 [Capitella teleta]|eukprot:ELT97379.1 hypothetical protein CAPTEDRAFT_190561 [Capitella teleta]
MVMRLTILVKVSTAISILMDDAEIMATTKKSALKKIQVLQGFCEHSGMIINQGKTKFMIINGSDQERQPLFSNGLTIINCDKYTYLGAVITQDASITSAVKEQCAAKKMHAIKFKAFTR